MIHIVVFCVLRMLMRILCTCSFNVFSGACWIYLDIRWDTSLEFQIMLLRARERFDLVISGEVIIIPMWALWTHRNGIIFYAGVLSFANWKRSFVDGMQTVTLWVKPPIKDKLNVWLSSLP